jgi:hypothetical protein
MVAGPVVAVPQGENQDMESTGTADAESEQALENEGPPENREDGSSDAEDEAFLQNEEKAEIEAPEEEKDMDRHEDPDEQIFSLGARVRWIMIPEWFIKMFGVDTQRASRYESNLPLISNVGVGPEFTYRKDGFDITAAVWYAGLGWDPISMKGSDQDENSWEVVENDMHAILLTVDFIWSTSFTDWLAITYGAGLGLGIKWGDIVETEATEASGGLEKCEEEDIGNDDWCNEGEEYGKTYDKLPVVPWIEFLLGLRFKPHRHVAIYVDGGFGLGFQVGTRAAYIF